MDVEQLSYKVIGSSLKVYRSFGSGLLESAYQECLYYSLIKMDLMLKKEKPMPVIFEEAELDWGYRLDLLVENRIVVELKSVEAFNDVHLAQVLSYLKLGDFELGLLINFNVKQLKRGIKRVVN